MNIIDILIAKKKSFTGETESLVRRANEAMAQANTVANKIEDAQEALEAAQTANETAQSVAANLEELQTNLSAAAANVVDDRINVALSNLNINNVVTSTSIEDDNTNTYKGKRAKISKNGVESSYNVEKNYTSVGQNEDGAMTQKAITNALNTQKTYLENKINSIPVSGGSNTNVTVHFSADDANSLVAIDSNGDLTPSSIKEEDVIKTQFALGTYTPISAVGIEIDYDNRTIARRQEAEYLSAGTDFDSYPMYGGRKRCIVNNNGEIVAFYGENNYVEDGSAGQVMVYQPKFYYMRTPLRTTNSAERIFINQEIIYISAVKQAGFTIHPIFLDENDHELDYVLLSAYEGSAFDTSANSYNTNDAQNVDFSADLLSSIANVKPISGVSQNLNVANAEQLAQNRGANWHLTNLAAEAMNQLLMIIEFGALNIQNAFNKGITKLTERSSNISCYTGATSALGNSSGMAAETTDGTNTYTTEGYSAISYRGVENPYGNIWTFIGDVKVVSKNGTQYMTYKDNKNETKTFTSAIANSTNWISYFGYDKNATWAFIPVQAQNANSAVPVGDYVYVNATSTNDKCCGLGGKASANEYAGPFYYAMDYNYDTSMYSYGGRLMYKPVYNSDAYLMNIAKWSGGDGNG